MALVPGNNIQLLCKAHSKLAQLHWRHSGQLLHPDDKHYFSDWGLLIVNASISDAGLYICDSVKKTSGRVYNKTVASYQLSPTNDGTFDSVSANCQSGTVVVIFKVFVTVLSLACFCLTVIIVLRWRRERLRRFTLVQRARQGQGKRQSDKYNTHISSISSNHWVLSMKPLNAISQSIGYMKGNGGPSSTQAFDMSALLGPDHIAETELWLPGSIHTVTWHSD